MPLFWRSSGILKMVMSLFMSCCSSFVLGWARFHFVFLGLFRRRHHLRGASLGLDFLQSGFGKMVRPHQQAFGQFSRSQDSNPISRPVRKAGLAKRFLVYSGAVREAGAQVADVDH